MKPGLLGMLGAKDAESSSSSGGRLALFTWSGEGERSLVPFPATPRALRTA